MTELLEGTYVDDGSERYVSPTCDDCARLQSILDRTCPAFPDRIPDEIWEGLLGHTAPYPGDHGIQFERMQWSKGAAGAGLLQR
jgi:hypothetical protein